MPLCTHGGLLCPCRTSLLLWLGVVGRRKVVLGRIVIIRLCVNFGPAPLLELFRKLDRVSGLSNKRREQSGEGHTLSKAIEASSLDSSESRRPSSLPTSKPG